METICTVAIAVSIAALNTSPPLRSARGGAARPPAENERPDGIPLKVHWETRSVTAAELDLVAWIEFAAPVAGLNLSLTVPSGLRVSLGPVAGKVSAPADLLPVAISYRFRIVAPVAGDVVIALRGSDGEIRTEAAYRPGMPFAEPLSAPPKAPPEPQRVVPP